MPSRFRFQGFVCLLCTLAALAFAAPMQEKKQPTAAQKQPTPTFSVEAAMVVVDITVRDRKGNLIEDLKREDFKIFEDNTPQGIVTFSAEKVPIGPAAAPETPAPKPEAAQPAAPVSGAPAPAPGAPAPPSTSAPAVVNLSLNPNAPVKKESLSGKRLMVLFFDLSSLDSETLIRSMDAAREFVEKNTGPQDLMAIATYQSDLYLDQDLTNDKEVLLRVIDSLGSEESTETTTENLSDESTSEDVFVPDTVQFNIFNTDRRLSALESLAKMYREFPERKSLIYFSGGVSTTGQENNAQIRSTIDSANKSNMTIYTVDTRGLQALPPGGNASQASAGSAMFRGGAMSRQRGNLAGSQETLVTLANDTGGRAFTDSNDISMALKQVQADTNVYYVIGYFSSNPKEDGKYRKIKVELARTELRAKIEHRPGYFAAKSFRQQNKEERDFQLQQAMTVDRPFVDVPLILQADYFRRDDEIVYVPVSIELLGDGLEFEEKGENREGKFEFVAQAVDSKGKISGVARDSVQVKLPTDRAEKIKSGGIFYSTGFQLKPGSYRMKFLVRDNVTGKLGSFEQPIDVPTLDLKKLTTSSIILANQLASTGRDSTVSHTGTMRRFQEQGFGFGYDPLVTGGKKIVPSIGNVFLARQTVYVYFQVYGATADPETKKPCIQTALTLIRNNTKILETQPQYIQDWTALQMGMGRGRGAARGAAPGGDMPMPPDMGGRGGRGDFGGRMGGPEGMFPGFERTGESTVAISLPLRSLKKGTYTLQVHVRDVIADLNLFQRVPIVIQ
jgi:VWFA-related protein